MTEQTFTTTEVAKLLGVNRKTVYKWVVSGKMEAYRTSAEGIYRVSAAEVRRHANENKIPLPDTL